MNKRTGICGAAECCPAKKCPHKVEHELDAHKCGLLYCNTIEGHIECGPVIKKKGDDER